MRGSHTYISRRATLVLRGLRHGDSRGSGYGSWCTFKEDLCPPQTCVPASDLCHCLRLVSAPCSVLLLILCSAQPAAPNTHTHISLTRTTHTHTHERGLSEIFFCFLHSLHKHKKTINEILENFTLLHLFMMFKKFTS